MKKKIIIITSIIILIIGIILKLNINKIKLSLIKYDVLIEKHRYEYEGINNQAMIPAGGYSTNYFYTVINTEKKEKYTVTYQDIYDIQNKKGNIDTLKINIIKMKDKEIEKVKKTYKLNKRKKRLTSLLNKTINEKYKITEIKKQ